MTRARSFAGIPAGVRIGTPVAFPFRQGVTCIDRSPGVRRVEPAMASKVDSIVSNLKSKSFDTERKMVARMQLEADCFLVKDIVKIISTIELEENRMDCIVASLTQVYDLAVISELLNLVILERNKEAIQQKISQLQNQ